MKHVFVTPNPISYLVALEIARVHCLNRMNCLVLYTRSFAPKSSDIAVVRVPFQFNDFHWSGRFWKTWKTMKKFDDWVHRTIGMPYRLYLPHSAMPQYQLMMSHPLCQAVAYIEEGTIAYYDKSELRNIRGRHKKARLKDILIRAISYKNRYTKNGAIFPHRSALVFGITPESFPWANHREIVRNAIKHGPEQKNAGLDIVLAVRPVLDGIWTKKVFEEALLRLSSWAIDRGYKSVGIKPHPGHSVESDIPITAFELLQATGLEVSPVPQSFYLELYLRSENATVVSMGSSIDFYEALTPGRVVLLGAFIPEQARLRQYVDEHPFAVRPRLQNIVTESKNMLKRDGACV